MLSLVCDEAFLYFFQIFSVPDTIALYSVGLQHRCSCFASHARTIIPVFWNIDKIGSIVERYLQSKLFHSPSLENVSSYEENAELTQGIQELHALVCGYLYNRYQVFVLQYYSGYDSPHIDHSQLAWPLQWWTEEEVNNEVSENCVVTILHDDLLGSQPLPVPVCVGMDRRGPSANDLSVDMATELEA